MTGLSSKGNLCQNLISFQGLVADPLIKLRSYRFTVLVGLLLMSSGLVLSAFAKHPVDVYLAVGLLVGKGKEAPLQLRTETITEALEIITLTRRCLL